MAKKRKRPRRRVEVDGQNYLLPQVTPGRTTTDEERLQLAEFVCMLYASDKYSLRQCLAAAGISSPETWYRWTADSEQIDTLYKEAQESKNQIYTGDLVERARTMLERHVEGFTVTTFEYRRKPTIPVNGSEPVMEIEQEIEKQIFIRPNFKAAEFVLINLDSKNFLPDPNLGKKIDLPDDIKIQIVGGSMPPVTREEDITFDRSKYNGNGHSNGHSNGNGNGKGSH